MIVEQARVCSRPMIYSGRIEASELLRLLEPVEQQSQVRQWPLDLGTLRALGGSPLRLDVYCWLTYRMSYLRRRTEVPWSSLRLQFGSNNADTPKGRAQVLKDFLAALREVLLVYREANVETSKGGVVLLPSRTHVPLKGLRELILK